jgi:hypothetical protein
MDTGFENYLFKLSVKAYYEQAELPVARNDDTPAASPAFLPLDCFAGARNDDLQDNPPASL